MTVLDEAARLTSADRQASYDHPRRNITQTADLFSAYLRRKLAPGCAIDARDVAWLMVLVKASRDSHARKRDNLVDAAGWARVAEMLDEEEP